MSSVWIIDFGSQYTQLILRRTRELQFCAEVLSWPSAKQRLAKGESPSCFILSGGPGSVANEQLENYAPIFESSLPVLGICYGHQLMASYYGGPVSKGRKGEYGATNVHLAFASDSCKELGQLMHIPKQFCVWMAHFDEVTSLPPCFEKLMVSEGGVIAAMRHHSRPQWSMQFHPEVDHSEFGSELLLYFFQKVAHLTKDWSFGQIYETAKTTLNSYKKAPVLCAFSGGVDSLVAATLVDREWPGQLYCFFVDNGLLRPQDYEHLKALKEFTSLKIEVISAQGQFLTALKGVSEPEEKRRIIGHTFIDVFEKKVKEYQEQKGVKFQYLLQGTLYPDVIESGGQAKKIKSHHNVGGLPEKMNINLLEPFRFLFKDEVREIGKQLDLKHEWLWRHPCPGPALGVRILGDITEESLRMAQMSDQILFEELSSFGLYHHTWQAFTVLLPVYTVGVKGDERTYEKAVVVRCVDSQDGMTAKVTEFPFSFLKKVASRIANEVPGVGRVTYDITSKPPATIEWE